MRSRFLMECTTPEVEAYLAGGGTTALLPVGCTEMHGPHQPLGTDTLIGVAFALRLAEAADALVLPEIHYAWSGATDGFAGTISVEQDLLKRTLTQVVTKVWRMGFRRIGVLSVHGPNNLFIAAFAREIFERQRIPAVFLNPYNPFTEQAAAVFAGDAGQSKEASVVLAALHILGKADLYSEQQMKYADAAPPDPPSLKAVRPGVVGFFMQDPRQHACPSEHVSLARGLEFYDLQVPPMVRILEALGRYVEDLPGQRNQGWWGEG